MDTEVKVTCTVEKHGNPDEKKDYCSQKKKKKQVSNEGLKKKKEFRTFKDAK